VETSSFEEMTDAQKAAVRKVLSRYSEVSGLSFVEVTETTATNSPVGTLRYGTYEEAGSTTSGYARGNNVWMRRGYMDGYATIDEGTRPYNTLLHESGHAMGLNHPGSDPGDGGRPFNDTDYGLTDIRTNNVMSYVYRTDKNTTAIDGGTVNPTTLMMWDAAAMQYLYGVNYNTNAGNTVYGNAASGATGINVYDAATPFFKNIWDGGGNDTIDISNYVYDCVVSLIPGTFSSLHSMAAQPSSSSQYWGHDNLSISYNVIIENATGGAGNDVLIGNDVANVLTGNAGNDVLEGGLGNDTLDGGAGLDVASYQHATAAVVASLNGNTLTNATYGTDTLISIEGLMGSDYNDTLTGDSADNVLEGGLGNDILDGAGGNDTVAYLFATAGVTIDLGIAAAQNTVAAGTDTLSNFENVTGGDYNDTLSGNAGNNVLNGGAGDDTLSGNAGDDTLIGGRGNDSLTGGLGHDIFKYTNPDGTSIGGLGNDKIYDFTSNFDAVFDANEDVIDLSAFFSQNGITVDASNITHYVHMSTSTLGLMKIDTTAAGASGTAAYSFLTLSGTSNIFSDSNLANLIQAHQLIL
ncbi:MAG: M10 family metallopeptidase C-terminal domain-containing protein, partial [Rhodocyclales bacterium]|nr:M10 family metallopeptidase C-terminal domain-containing protein [Rhodocyclales bacterium]